MFDFLKKMRKWTSSKSSESKKDHHGSFLLVACLSILEDCLFWKKIWMSLSCIIVLNILFFFCYLQQIHFLQCLLGVFSIILCLDAFESWLIYKHRISCLKRIGSRDNVDLISAIDGVKNWIKTKMIEYIHLRDINPTKAFLLMNIFFSLIFLMGSYIHGYMIMYISCMSLCIIHKLAPYTQRILKKIQQNAESDNELEGLIPDVSEVDIKLLSIEPECNQVFDEKQSLDYWKPEDLPVEDTSDSSDNSSSLVTNLSMEKMITLQKDDIDSSDSSENEYIPLDQQREPLQSTLEVIQQPSGTWSTTAYNAFFNLTGTVASMMYSNTENKRKRVSSVDSSDGFEMIDKNDL